MDYDFKENEVEGLKGQVRTYEGYVNQFRNELLMIGSSLQGVSLMARSIPLICENMYGKEGKFRKLNNEIKDAFSSSMSSLNEFVQNCRQVSSSLEGWFTILKNAKESLAKRDSTMKSFYHYDKKLKKLRDEKEKAIQRNPRYIEKKSKTDRLLRNERKFETSKGNYLISSQTSYTSSHACINSVIAYINPALIRFFRDLVRFYKQTALGLSPLSDLEEVIKNLDSKNDSNEAFIESFKKKEQNITKANFETLQPQITPRKLEKLENNLKNEESKANIDFDSIFQNMKLERNNNMTDPKKANKEPEFNINTLTNKKAYNEDEFGLISNNKTSREFDNFQNVFAFNNTIPNTSYPNKNEILEEAKPHKQFQTIKSQNTDDPKKKIIQSLIKKTNEERKNQSIRQMAMDENNKINELFVSQSQNFQNVDHRKSNIALNQPNNIEFDGSDLNIFKQPPMKFEAKLNYQNEGNKPRVKPENEINTDLMFISDPVLKPSNKKNEDSFLLEEIQKSLDNTSQQNHNKRKENNQDNNNQTDINAQLLLQTQLMMLQTMNQMNLLAQQNTSNYRDPNDPFSGLNQNIPNQINNQYASPLSLPMPENLNPSGINSYGKLINNNVTNDTPQKSKNPFKNK